MNYLYMNEQGQQIQYYQFLKFLLELPLSQNARIIYMLLYDRARISQKNNWMDECLKASQNRRFSAQTAKNLRIEGRGI